MSEIVIRRATMDDAAGINSVYNPFIRHSAITFETAEYSESDRRDWLTVQAKSLRYPVVVAVGEAGVCGFASAAPFDPRGGYATSVKTSVFIDPQRQGAGLGQRLYAALFAALAGTGAHRTYALIAAPNPASVALHEAFGFAHVATLDEVGRKFDCYHSVMWFEKRL